MPRKSFLTVICLPEQQNQKVFREGYFFQAAAQRNGEVFHMSGYR